MKRNFGLSNPEAPLDDLPEHWIKEPPENGPWWLLFMIVFGAVIIVLTLLTYAFAHTAESGWQYPQRCCGGQHCKLVDCDALTETKDGVRYLNLLFKDILPSGDKNCHVCIEDYGSHKIPRCVFILPGA